MFPRDSSKAYRGLKKGRFLGLSRRLKIKLELGALIETPVLIGSPITIARAKTVTDRDRREHSKEPTKTELQLCRHLG